MPVQFTANIEEDSRDGKWLIRLTDTLENKETLCKSLEDLKIKMGEFGTPYNGDVEVVWSKDKDVTDANFKEIHDGMASYKEEEPDATQVPNG